MLKKYFIAGFIILNVCVVGIDFVQCQEKLVGTIVTLLLKDNRTFSGKIIRQDDKIIVLLTHSGIEMKVPRSQIQSVEYPNGQVSGNPFRRMDPNHTRLMMAPTGRQLRQGEGYFSDIYIFFPSVTYGVTNNISISAGISVIPFVDFASQIKYAAPRLGFQISDEAALTAGALFVSGIGGSSGLVFAGGSIGPPHKSLTFGIGFSYSKTKSSALQFSKYPIVILGGNIQLGSHVSLVSETWLFLGKDFNLKEQPFGFAFRLFGDYVAIDLGFILFGSMLGNGGFPIPWLSATFNF